LDQIDIEKFRLCVGRLRGWLSGINRIGLAVEPVGSFQAAPLALTKSSGENTYYQLLTSLTSCCLWYLDRLEKSTQLCLSTLSELLIFITVGVFVYQLN